MQKVLQQKLKEHRRVSINYKRVNMGKDLALKQLYGNWDSSFDNLCRFKAQVESCCPGSLVVIVHHTTNSKIRFRKTILCFKTLRRRVSMGADGFLFSSR